MSNLIYRVVSPCAVLGAGFPEQSFSAAMAGRVDAIAINAGLADGGPYYLGTGQSCFDRAAVRADLLRIVRAAHSKGCTTVIGNCGIVGGDGNLGSMVEIVREVFAEVGVRSTRVAVIHSHLAPELAIAELRGGRLRPTGVGPEPSEQTLRDSVIVGRMGVHPLITAIEKRARFVLAGRACDASLFAADVVRRGIQPGLAYHLGHVLAGGALASDPGSTSDCLIGEIYDDDAVLFVVPNADRRCTVPSIAAHGLYRQGHPQLQAYPEGIFSMEKTQFFSVGGNVAGIRNSRFVYGRKPWHLRIELDGARFVGHCRASLIRIDPADLPRIPSDLLVYGRNGVQAGPVAEGEFELGIIIETRSATPVAAARLATSVAHVLAHFGYPGRKSGAGSLAFPVSPHAMTFKFDDGTDGALVVGGTRDPVFLKNYPMIKASVVKACEESFAHLLGSAAFQIFEVDASSPAILLRSVDRDPGTLEERHAAALDSLRSLSAPVKESRLYLDAPDVYEWSLAHVASHQALIERMFPIELHDVTGADWRLEETAMPEYRDIGEYGDGDIDPRTLSSISEMEPAGDIIAYQSLLDMAALIRSANVAANRLTFDIVFNSGEQYESALSSNVFCRSAVAALLDIPQERVVGTYFVDSCNAIKITVDRPQISGSPGERDVAGNQQQSALERLEVPIYADPTTRSSAF